VRFHAALARQRLRLSGSGGEHSSVAQDAIDIRAMDRGVARGTPAGAPADRERVIFISDKKPAPSLRLRVAAQAKIWIGLHQHFVIDGAVRPVTGGAAFAQRLVFENETPGLLTMTAGTLLIQPRHAEPAGWLHDVEAVWIVALDAIHLSLAQGMVPGEIEFGVDFEVTGKTGLRLFPRVHDELPAPPAGRDVFASSSMTRFASRAAGHSRVLNVNARVRTRGECARVIRVAIDAAFVAHKSRALDFRGRNHTSFDRRTGDEKKRNEQGDKSTGDPCGCAPDFPLRRRCRILVHAEHGGFVAKPSDAGKYGFTRS